MAQFRSAVLLVFVAVACLVGDAHADELEDELALAIEGLHAFGVRGLPAAYKHAAGGAKRREAIALGLNWLTAHQSGDGTWKPHELFWCHGKENHDAAPSGKGKALYEIGITGMTVSAYLGAGYTHRGSHPHAHAVRKALIWLVAAQGKDGCVGPRTVQQYVYNHAFATLALVEAYALTGDPKLRRPAQKAIDFSAFARNPGLAWRYGIRPGENDTSVTGCMGMPLYVALRLNRAGERAGLLEPIGLDDAAFAGIRNWLDKVTDPDYARVGYVMRGTGPARPQAYVDEFPGDKSESLTAIAVLMRLVLPGRDETAKEKEKSAFLIAKGVELMLDLRPLWSESEGSIDFYYWYYASMALRQVGGPAWKAWDEALAATLLGSQCQHGRVCGRLGSWDAVSIWAKADGGRIYATAMALLMLETPDRMRPIPSDRSDLIEAVRTKELSADRRASILRGLGQLRVPKAGEAVTDWLTHEAAAVRAAAAEALGHLEVDGKSVRALARLLDDKEPAVRLAVVRALVRQGPKARSALGKLAEHLDDEDAEVAAGAARAIGVSGTAAAAETLRPRLKTGPMALRVAAAAAVYELTSETMDALPVLLEGLAAPSVRVRVQAAAALEQIKPKAAQAGAALLGALKDASADVRIHAAGALYATGQSQEACIDAWISALDAADGRSRMWAMQRLQLVGSPRPTAKLAQQLFGGSSALRIQAAATLEAAGHGARPAAAALAWGTQNGPSAVRKAASRALAALEMDVPSARTHLMPQFAAKPRVPRLEEGAATALVLLGEPIVPTLIDALRHGSDASKLWMLQVLGRLGPTAETAVPEIARALREGDRKRKYDAAIALARIGPRAVGALSALETLLDGRDASLQRVALDAVASIAPGSDRAVQMLVKAAQRTGREYQRTRAGAVIAMASLGKRGEGVVGFLFTILAGDDKSLREHAITTLAALWPYSERSLRVALEKGGPKVRWAAAEVIIRVGPDARKLIKPLTKMLEGGGFSGDAKYADALGAIGKPAVTALIKLLRSKRADVRREAARALGLIGPDAKKSLKHLKKLLSDRDPMVASKARRSIKRIDVKKKKS